MIEDDHAAELADVPLHCLGPGHRRLGVRPVGVQAVRPGPAHRACWPATRPPSRGSSAGCGSAAAGCPPSCSACCSGSGRMPEVTAQVAAAAESYDRPPPRPAATRCRARACERQGTTGINVWVRVPDETRAISVLRDAGYAVAPGSLFRIDAPPGIRVTVSPLDRRRHRAAVRGHRRGREPGRGLRPFAMSDRGSSGRPATLDRRRWGRNQDGKDRLAARRAAVDAAGTQTASTSSRPPRPTARAASCTGTPPRPSSAGAPRTPRSSSSASSPVTSRTRRACRSSGRPVGCCARRSTTPASTPRRSTSPTRSSTSASSCVANGASTRTPGRRTSPPAGPGWSPSSRCSSRSSWWCSAPPRPRRCSGPAFRVTQSRGQLMPWPASAQHPEDFPVAEIQALATIHPSAVLRADDRDDAYQRAGRRPQGRAGRRVGLSGPPPRRLVASRCSRRLSLLSSPLLSSRLVALHRARRAHRLRSSSNRQ